MAFKTVCITLHPDRRQALDTAKRAVELLKAAGVYVTLDPLAGKSIQLELPEADFTGRTPYPDCILAVGGDGTLLRAAQYALTSGAPLIGVNSGHVGFLSEVEQDQLPEALNMLLQGNYTVESRLLLSVSAGNTPCGLALNDAVVSRGGYAKLITLDAYISGDHVGRYVADGIVVASPTGSTGYSLSAGGPIISPEVACMVMTPICAHSLQHRPVIASPEAEIKLQLDCEESQGIQLTLDGQVVKRLGMNEAVTIRKSEKSIQLIHLSEPHFFRRVREKLVEWSR